MTKVTCPKCNHTFDIDDSGYNPWSTKPGWTKYSNPHGLKCECDCCHKLSDEIYMYYDKDYYKHLPIPPLPLRKFICKNCISNFLSRRQLLEIERDGYTY